MRLVLIESPLSGNTPRNVRYAKAAVADCLARKEAAFASHLLYPMVLSDDVPDERRLGIEAGLAWGARADATVAYIDLGITPGMAEGIARAEAEGRTIEFRSLPSWSRCGKMAGESM